MPEAATMRVNPAVLQWVMDNEGWEVDELAAASGLSPERIRRWTTAESYISMRDLKKMSAMFTRPMSVLLLAEAPPTTVPRYRRGGSEAGTRPSRAVLEVIRKARCVQDNAAELLATMGRNATPIERGPTLDQSPELTASKSAAILGIEPPKSTGQGTGRDRKRYNMIREKIESKNVFTVQEKIPEDGMAGLALVDATPAIILVNWRDPIRRRIFTILHEYAHVLLSNSGICPTSDAHQLANNGGDALDIERWCDMFAGAVLMPTERFRDALHDAHKSAGGDPLQAVTNLSNKFCVSRMAAAVRATLVLGDHRLRAEYSRCCGALGQETGGGAKSKETEQDAAFGVRQAVRCIAQKGRMYTSLVAVASESGAITTSTALDYLEIKLKNFDELKVRCRSG